MILIAHYVIGDVRQHLHDMVRIASVQRAVDATILHLFTW